MWRLGLRRLHIRLHSRHRSKFFHLLRNKFYFQKNKFVHVVWRDMWPRMAGNIGKQFVYVWNASRRIDCWSTWRHVSLLRNKNIQSYIFILIICLFIFLRFGRKITFTCSVILLGAMMTGSAFAPDMITFCILRFFCGIGSCGLFLTLFVWGVEAVGKKYRVICGCIYQIMYAMGAIILGVLGYFIRDWRTLQLIIALPIFIFTTYYW